jgi:hypothetical protein
MYKFKYSKNSYKKKQKKKKKNVEIKKKNEEIKKKNTTRSCEISVTIYRLGAWGNVVVVALRY